MSAAEPAVSGLAPAAAGRASARRVPLPRRLSTLLALLVVALFSGSMTVFTYHVLQDEVTHITTSLELQAAVLARNLAATGADHLLARDYTSLEQMLLRTIEFPGVTEIQMLDARGKRVSEVVRAQGVVTAHYGRPALALPPVAEASLRRDDTHLEVWQPVVLGELLGWVRIAHSLEDIARTQQRVWTKHSLLGALLLVISVVLLLAILRRPITSIERYTEFADRIDDSKGAQVPVCKHPGELERLGQALNRASFRLHEQNITIREALADLQRLAAFPEKSPDIVLAVTVGGDLEYVNPHGHRTLAELGLALDQFHALLPVNLREVLEHGMRENISTRAVEATYAGRAWLWTFAPISARDVVHCYAHEITEKKQAEEQARHALLETRAAQAANRAKSTFLANMSHEIRTPLTAIIGFSESLLDSGQSMTERVAAINTVIRAGRHLLHIINEILDLSKIEAERIEIERIRVPLFALLEDIAALARLQAEEKGIGFSIEPAFPLPATITSDPVRLKQILLNLVNNAIKFTERGQVTVRVALRASAEILHVEVLDTGIGIAPETLARLFQPFSQADTSTTRRFGGTGLGLYLSKLLAEKLGGMLSASSTPGAGSCFTCTVSTGALAGVPLLEAPPPRTDEATRVAVAPATVSGNVLLVEDNADNQRLVSLYLRNLGAAVTLANNGAEGVERALAGDFDLVLMDMQMPVMDGLEATRALRAHGYRGPIVALTAGAMQSDIQRALDAGCNGHLTKPIERMRFQTTISRYLRSRSVPAPPESPLGSTLLQEDAALADIVAQFVTRLPQLLDDLAHSVASGAWDAVRAKAHDLKAVGGGYGFAPLSEVAARLEFELAKQSYDRLPALLEELRRLQRRIAAGASAPPPPANA